MKRILLVLMILNHSISFSFFGAEAETARAYDIMEGMILTANLIDDLDYIKDNGISYEEVERLATNNVELASELKGQYLTTSREVQNLKNIEAQNRRSNEVSNTLRKSASLIQILCSLSPSSCTAALTHSGNKEQRRTTEELQKINLALEKEVLNRELEKLIKVKNRSEVIVSIIGVPKKFIEVFSRGRN